MFWFNVAMVLLWLFVGVVNYHFDNVNKFQYGLMWIVLMANLISRCFTG